MTFKTHYEAVQAGETLCEGDRLVTAIDGSAYILRPRPDTVLLTREEVEAIRKELIEIKEAFQWTFDNMGTQHTSDHFNIPANGVQQVDQLINNQFK